MSPVESKATLVEVCWRSQSSARVASSWQHLRLTALEGSGCKQGGGAVHGPEPRWPLFLPGDSVGRGGRVFGTQSCPGVRWELGTAAVAKHWQEQKVTVTHLPGYGHEVWSHNPSVFTHLKDI